MNNSGDLITYPCRYALAGPEFDKRSMPRPFVFKEDGDCICLAFAGELFCRWLAKMMQQDARLVLLGEHANKERNGHFVVDADGFPLCECGVRRVAEMIRDLLNKYQPELRPQLQR